MFAKIFTQIFDSSIVEHPEVRFTFMDLLALCDCNGVVDMTHEAIARRTNRPLALIRSTIAELEQPDTRSRTPDNEGRRIVRLDEHRDWGWLIANYERFRMTASEEQRREKTNARVRKHREGTKAGIECNAHVTPCNAPQRMKRHAEAEAEADAKNPPPSAFTPPERARGALQPEPDPNIMPAAPRRPVNPSQRKPVDVQECLAMASRIGWGEPEARRWHSDMEASGWAKVDGTPFGNWSREMCIARDRSRETQARNGGGKPTTATATARHGPSLREVQTYAETKDDGSRRASGYAVSWWQAWEGRRWKNKEGHAIDWQIVFAKDVQNHLRAPMREG